MLFPNKNPVNSQQANVDIVHRIYQKRKQMIKGVGVMIPSGQWKKVQQVGKEKQASYAHKFAQKKLGLTPFCLIGV